MRIMRHLKKKRLITRMMALNSKKMVVVKKIIL